MVINRSSTRSHLIAPSSTGGSITSLLLEHDIPQLEAVLCALCSSPDSIATHRWRNDGLPQQWLRTPPSATGSTATHVPLVVTNRSTTRLGLISPSSASGSTTSLLVAPQATVGSSCCAPFNITEKKMEKEGSQGMRPHDDCPTSCETRWRDYLDPCASK
jgi:hypothetical protein